MTNRIQATHGGSIGFILFIRAALLIAVSTDHLRMHAADTPPAPPVWVLSDGNKVDKLGTRLFVLDEKQALATLKLKNRIWDSATSTVTLAGARGETIAFQLGLEGGDTGRKAVDVKCSDLAPATLPPAGQPPVPTIRAAQFTLYKMYYTQVTDGGSGPTNRPSMGNGWYPDALVPWSVPDTNAFGGYDGPPFDIAAKEIQGIWIDLTIPYGSHAGDYIATLEISGLASKLIVKLHVYDFDLPRAVHNTFFMNFGLDDLNQAGDYWLEGEKLAAYENEVYRIARRHRFIAGNMYDTDKPKIEENADGLVHVDWTDYDKHHDKVLNPADNLFGPGEAPIELWKVPLYTGLRSGDEQCPKGDKAWDGMIDEIKKHWAARHWDLSKAYVYLSDEPWQLPMAEKLNEFARRIKVSEGPKLRSCLTLYAILGHDYKAQKKGLDIWKDNLDMWLISGDRYSLENMKTLPDSAQRGIYQGGEPYEGNDPLDADGVAMRTWAWVAWQYHLDLQCFYSMSEGWRKAVPDPKRPGKYLYLKGKEGANLNCEIWDNPRNRSWAVGQGVFLYPGKKVDWDFPVLSLRLKQIRRGQTDYEYFWLLRQAGEGALADSLCKSVLNVALSEAATAPEQFGAGKWSHNPDDWDAAIAKAAHKLEELKDKLPKEPAQLAPAPINPVPATPPPPQHEEF